MAEGYSQGQLDQLAKQQGFRDYATWSAWDRHRREMLSQNPAAAAGPLQLGGQPGAPKNWLQNLMESIPGHPAHVLQYVNRRLGQAFGSPDQ